MDRTKERDGSQRNYQDTSRGSKQRVSPGKNTHDEQRRYQKYDRFSRRERSHSSSKPHQSPSSHLKDNSERSTRRQDHSKNSSRVQTEASLPKTDLKRSLSKERHSKNNHPKSSSCSVRSSQSNNDSSKHRNTENRFNQAGRRRSPCSDENNSKKDDKLERAVNKEKYPTNGNREPIRKHSQEKDNADAILDSKAKDHSINLTRAASRIDHSKDNTTNPSKGGDTYKKTASSNEDRRYSDQKRKLTAEVKSKDQSRNSRNSRDKEDDTRLKYQRWNVSSSKSRNERHDVQKRGQEVHTRVGDGRMKYQEHRDEVAHRSNRDKSGRSNFSKRFRTPSPSTLSHHHRGSISSQTRRGYRESRSSSKLRGVSVARKPHDKQDVSKLDLTRSKRHSSSRPIPECRNDRSSSKVHDVKDSLISSKRKRSVSLSSRSSSSKQIRIADKNANSPRANSNESSNDGLENLNVEKWVRSAPEEQYYMRDDSGEFRARTPAKLLCDKFERKLLLKAQALRLEAEQLGQQTQAELAEKERGEIQRQREERLRNKQKKCCSHSSEKKCDSLETKEHEAQEISKSRARGACKHEEGELCDCGSNNPKENKEPGMKKLCDKSNLCDKVNNDKCSNKNSSSNSNKEIHTCKDGNCKEEGKQSNKKEPRKKCKKPSSSSSSDSDSDSSDSSSDSSDEECGISRSDAANRELEKKKQHPRRLHEELWHNDPGLMNDGPVCRCSARARRRGIRHGFYPGENENPPPMCDPYSNNKDRLVHYRMTISPPKNFLVKTPSVINHDGHEYIFEGFSLFSHHKVDVNLPPCKVIRFNIKYDVFVAEEKFPESFCVRELDLFEKYVFREVLELLDLKYDWNEEGKCPPFHLMPRFVRQLPDNGKEILSMSRVLLHMIKSDRELIKEDELPTFFTVEQTEWQNFADKHKGEIVTKFGQKPAAIRVDQIDRNVAGQEADCQDGIPFPVIVHFGIRPPQLSYAGNTSYQRAWRRFVKYRHLLSNMAKPSAEEKRKLAKKEMKLQEMRTASSMKRDVTVDVSSKGFRTTGIFCDLVQHAMLIPVLVAHLRFHRSLSCLERRMNYFFKNRYLLQLAMTHPSYRENFGTNPDHARNALTNCGIRQPEYGDRRIHYASTRKRGINTLINIMAKFGSEREMESEITHNERLEFLGDAVVEFITSIHLFLIFSDLEEGGLATYRAAIVQNQHLAVLAQKLSLDEYMLYAHGSDLCHDSELRHAMANCIEATMGALLLDGGIKVADRVFGFTLYGEDIELHGLWTNYAKHPLQMEEPGGDRHWIESHNVLQKLTEFEESIGVEFTHIRLLARAFTDRSLGYNNLSRGSNQRLEFLGDTVLQLISSEYLYRHFPDHHEGHLSLLRSSLVNNRTQSIVCDDLGMTQYAMRGDPKSEMKTKDRADLLEAFLGALYIDKGLMYCTTFCSVCFFPRLNKSIIKQEWNDPKSKLQQCCLTLRAMDGREPDIPVYKVTQSLGPTNTRIYIVAVYFRNKRLATARGHSIQEAEMNAAAEALEESGHLFPQLHHQKSVMDKTSKRYRFRKGSTQLN